MTGQKHKNKFGALLDPKKYILTRFQKVCTREIVILCNNAYILSAVTCSLLLLGSYITRKLKIFGALLDPKKDIFTRFQKFAPTK